MRILLLPLLAGLAVAAEPAADWPCWRGPLGTGFAVDKGLNKDWKAKAPAELWRTAMESPGHSGMSVAGGTVFIIDHAGKQAVVRALSLADGKESWRFAFDDPDKDNFGFDRATPAVDGGHVYCLGRQGTLLCLDAKKGAKVWSTDLAKEQGARRPQWGITASPLIDGKALVVETGAKDGCLLLLDKATGKPLGKAGGEDGPSYASPVAATIDGKRQYVLFTAKRVAGIDAGKGAVLWQHPWETKYDVNAPTPLVMGDSVFITSGYGHGCALLDIAGGAAKVRWENKNMQSHFSSPIAHQGAIYGTTDPGQLMCLDAATGAVKWKQDGFAKGTVLGLDGALVAVGGDSGDTVLVKLAADAFTELGRVKPFAGKKGPYWVAPVAAEGRLLLRSPGELVCLDLR